MNYDVVCNLCMKQGCGGAAKIALLQFRPLQRMVNQTAYKKYRVSEKLCAVEIFLTMAVFVTQYLGANMKTSWSL